MRLHRSTLLALAACSFAGAQSVSVVQPQTPGLALIGPQADDFQSALTAIVGSPLPPEFAAYLPFTVILKNNSAEPLVAYSIFWAEDPTPNRRSGGVGIGMASIFGTDGYLKPGASLVAMPAGAFGSPPIAAELTALQRNESTAIGLQKDKAVVISLDSAIFASGQFVGPDTKGNFNRDVARFSAWRAVDSNVQSELAKGTPFETISAQLQQIADQPIAAAVTRNWNQAEQAREAGRLLRIYGRSGVQGVSDLVNRQLQAPIVNVHR